MNSIILSSYFTGKPDPQRGLRLEPDDTDYYRKWYDSIVAAGLNAVVFHDQTITKPSTDQVKFRLVKLGQYSLNDERFFHYQQYLKGHECDYVFMTDIADVVLIKDPVEFLETYGFPLAFGHDHGQTGPGTWIGELMKKIYTQPVLNGHPLVNAGVIGGTYKAVTDLLDKLCPEIKEYGLRGNCNMIALNRIMQKHYGPSDYWRGVPFTNKFKTYKNEDDVYVMHK